MSWFTKNRPPREEGYDSEQEFQDARQTYDTAEYWAIENAVEDYYNEK